MRLGGADTAQESLFPMYPVGGWIGLVRGRQARRAGPDRVAVPANVIFLGITSLLTDISSEMVVAALPVYLVGFLRISPAQFGIVDGLYQGGSGLVQLVAARFTDRLRRYKEVAALGYATSAATRIGLLLTTQWAGITALLAVDRLGKGVRTAPRDALISLSVDERSLGAAFGAHRAMDACGAMVGPVMTFAILSVIRNGFDVVFAVSLACAVIGVAVLLSFVENRPGAAPSMPAVPQGRPTGWTFLQDRRFRHLTVSALLLSLMTIGDAFVYLIVQEHSGVSMGTFPLLYVGTSASFLVFALPTGRLADRVGRLPVFFAGHVILLALYALLLSTSLGPWSIALAIAMLGVYYAATEGVLAALGSALVPPDMRASGLAVLATATALSRFVSSAGFGYAWTQFGLEAAVLAFGAGLALAVTVSILALPRITRV